MCASLPMSKCIQLILVVLLFCGSCTPPGQSKLSKALTAAVKEKKISEKGMETILKEYDYIRKEDRDKAREYVTLVLSAIEMGGDSSHIDVVRQRVVRSMKKKVKV